MTATSTYLLPSGMKLMPSINHVPSESGNGVTCKSGLILCAWTRIPEQLYNSVSTSGSDSRIARFRNEGTWKVTLVGFSKSLIMGHFGIFQPLVRQLLVNSLKFIWVVMVRLCPKTSFSASLYNSHYYAESGHSVTTEYSFFDRLQALTRGQVFGWGLPLFIST